MTDLFSDREWRDVPGYPAYQVSEFGDVYRDGRVLKPWKTKAGRWQVRLYNGNRGTTFSTYRLVAIAFLGSPPFPGAVVAHFDDCLDNNHVSNLRWATAKENGQDKIRNGRCARGLRNGAYTKPWRRPKGERSGKAKLTSEQVLVIREYQLGTAQLAQMFNVSRTTIKDIRRGKTWTHIAKVAR